MKRLYDKDLMYKGRAALGDNRIYDWKPKHLNSGKRGIGSTDRR